MKSGAREFRDRVSEGLANRRVRDAVVSATVGIDEKRRRAWEELPRIDEIRELAKGIKNHTLDHLDTYLEELTGNLERSGAQVVFAGDRSEANEAIVEIARRHRCRLAAKGKSMTSEEIELNEALIDAGVDVVETDLGEYIIQLDKDRPSHILAPIVHKDVASVAETFERELGLERTEEPKRLVSAAREQLRAVYRDCDLGITGANFLVAESGTVAILMNEGNGRFCTSLPRVHVVLAGIEKVVPRLSDLSVFLKLLPRTATGQRLTVDTKLITGPRREGDADGPEHLYVVLMDSRRTEILGSAFHETLRCIRCGACLNACPVYRTIGGHAYGAVYPGPIGKLITPLLTDEPDSPLPRASSLCGACFDACPVKIPIPSLLVEMREAQEKRGRKEAPARRKSMLLRFVLRCLASPWLYRIGQRVLRWDLRRRSREGWVSQGVGPLGEWTRARRDLPVPPPQSFRELWREGKGE